MAVEDMQLTLVLKQSTWTFDIISIISNAEWILFIICHRRGGGQGIGLSNLPPPYLPPPTPLSPSSLFGRASKFSLPPSFSPLSLLPPPLLPPPTPLLPPSSLFSLLPPLHIPLPPPHLPPSSHPVRPLIEASTSSLKLYSHFV